MKSIIIILFAILLTYFATAQNIFEKTISIKKNSHVSIDFQFADNIIIKTWNKKEAYVKATVNINDNEDNDKFSLEVKELSHGIKFESEIDDLDKINHKKTIHRNGDIIITDCVDMHIDFEVFLPGNAKIELETISGDIEIIGFSSAMNINTISGFIDISISQETKADIKMETITGEFYSNLDLEMEVEGTWKHHFIGGELEATLNGGGGEINLETISGNIYLRKK